MSAKRSRAARLASTVLPALLAAPCVDASEATAGQELAPRVQAAVHGGGTAARRHLRVDNRLGDLLYHPALFPFSRLMLPWDARAYDEAMPLKDVAQLLPYHEHVDPEVVVSARNRVIDDASEGRTVFHNIYSDAQRRANPSLQNTGLFHLRGSREPPSH